ncbi:hypothetical protein [Hymenobacter metallilatus]|uniref:Uncharacterized protein n=1 Tax=Hymenobacter metallilatus TaxID=2493666 RepID=A0A3R9MMB9_9BACT|nr:hypothetical protein [Hymenobacter metallilatus]RSK35372.1 hypothetical protein EI290_06645 [Hymenobacter metallilatus]
MNTLPPISSQAPLKFLSPEATETAFNHWLLELLPGVRQAIADQGFAKGQQLTAFRVYLAGFDPAGEM